MHKDFPWPASPYINNTFLTEFKNLFNAYINIYSYLLPFIITYGVTNNFIWLSLANIILSVAFYYRDKFFFDKSF